MAETEKIENQSPRLRESGMTTGLQRISNNSRPLAGNIWIMDLLLLFGPRVQKSSQSLLGPRPQNL